MTGEITCALASGASWTSTSATASRRAGLNSSTASATRTPRIALSSAMACIRSSTPMSSRGLARHTMSTTTPPTIRARPRRETLDRGVPREDVRRGRAREYRHRPPRAPTSDRADLHADVILVANSRSLAASGYHIREDPQRAVRLKSSAQARKVIRRPPDPLSAAGEMAAGFMFPANSCIILCSRP